MILPSRDRRILALLAAFSQLTVRHVEAMVFAGLSSSTPAKRALRRLLEAGLIERVQHRVVIGERGGPGHYVYQLSTNGMRLCGVTGKQRRRTVNFHALAVADAYAELLLLEAEGLLTIASWSAEPECWMDVGGVELRPDLHVEADIGGRRVLLNLEVDMGTEGRRHLREKLDACHLAWQGADVAQWPVFPRTVWIAVDVDRAKEIASVIRQLPDEAHQLFTVTTLPHLRLALT